MAALHSPPPVREVPHYPALSPESLPVSGTRKVNQLIEPTWIMHTAPKDALMYLGASGSTVG